MHTCSNPNQALCSSGSTAVIMFLGAVWCPFTEDTRLFRAFTSFPFSFFTRSVLLPGKDGTAGRTITRSECVWHVPCPSPRPQHGSASIASNRPQLCDTPCTCLHHLVAFRVLSSVSPNPFLQTLFLYSALRFFGNEVPVIFLWTLISRVHDAALRQPGKSILEEGVAKQIQRRDLTLTAP